MQPSYTKKLTITALFIAISFIGANISVFGSIAFDSLPAFLAALLLGPWYGAAIGFLGHLFTAITSGFPLSVPLHLVIAVGMAVTMLGFGFCYRLLANKVSEKLNFVITGIVGIVLNAPVSLSLSMAALAVIAGKEAALGLLTMLPVLTLVSVVNITMAFAAFIALRKIWDRV